MKIIFLDIDGVLNSQLSAERRIKNGTPISKLDLDEEKAPKGSGMIDEYLVSLLNDLIKKTQAKVVISSSWRTGKTIEELQELLEYKGFIGEVISITPKLYLKSNHEGDWSSVPRGVEILEWIRHNTELIGEQYHCYNRYIIFDDDSDMLLWQKENYFKCDSYSGLTPNLIYQAINFLNRK